MVRQQWEYKMEDVYANGIGKALATAGGEGWELVSLKYGAQEGGYGYSLVFKRPVVTQRSRSDTDETLQAVIFQTQVLEDRVTVSCDLPKYPSTTAKERAIWKIIQGACERIALRVRADKCG